MKDKLILDATSAFRMMWFDKEQENTVYLDKRSDEELQEAIEQFGKNRGRPVFKEPWNPENKTVKGDYRKLPYPDKSFKLIIFDPPHLVGSDSPRFQMGLQFGVLKAETWQSDISKASRELWRVLEDYGVLLFKWCDSNFDYERVLKLFPVRPLIRQVTSNKKNNKRKLKTYWFAFIKFPEISVSPKELQENK